MKIKKKKKQKLAPQNMREINLFGAFLISKKKICTGKKITKKSKKMR